MKFNEEQIKNLIQQEESTWNSDDLSWFDESYFTRFETKKMSPDERQKIIYMLANDQIVMNHYLAMKRNFGKSAQLSTGFLKLFGMKKPFVLMASFASLAVGFWLVYLNTQTIEDIDVYRSPTEVLMYPLDNMVLQNAPTYLVAPHIEAMGTSFKIVLHRGSHLIWETPELDTPRVYLPPEIRSQLTVGLYNWKIISPDNQLIHSYFFNIE